MRLRVMRPAQSFEFARAVDLPDKQMTNERDKVPPAAARRAFVVDVVDIQRPWKLATFDGTFVPVTS